MAVHTIYTSIPQYKGQNKYAQTGCNKITQRVMVFQYSERIESR